MQEKANWLQLIHCFNHRVELALKGAFKTTAFKDIDTMLCKLYYLYPKSAKRLSELRTSEAYDKTIRKLTKASGTRWINNRRAEIEGYVKNGNKYISPISLVLATANILLLTKEPLDKR